MKRDYNDCFAYSSSDSGCVCVSYRKYVNGFVRFGHNGLFVYLGTECRGRDLFTISGVDVI
jgi:hypothetical protein